MSEHTTKTENATQDIRSGELLAVLESCAQAAHEVNRAYCAAIGDGLQPSWQDAPNWQRASAVAGAAAAVLHGMTPPDSHEGWLRAKLLDGWTWGRARDPERKTHPCMLPYRMLPVRQRVKDTIFLAVVQGVFDAEMSK